DRDPFFILRTQPEAQRRATGEDEIKLCASEPLRDCLAREVSRRKATNCLPTFLGWELARLDHGVDRSLRDAEEFSHFFRSQIWIVLQHCRWCFFCSVSLPPCCAARDNRAICNRC